MNELFIAGQQPRVTELAPHFTAAAIQGLQDSWWSDPRALIHQFYRLLLVGA